MAQLFLYMHPAEPSCLDSVPACVCVCCPSKRRVQSGRATRGFSTAIHCFALNPCTNFHLHSLGLLLQVSLFSQNTSSMHRHALASAVTQRTPATVCSAFVFDTLQAPLYTTVTDVSFFGIFLSGQITLNKFFLHKGFWQHSAACMCL